MLSGHGDLFADVGKVDPAARSVSRLSRVLLFLAFVFHAVTVVT